MKMEYVNYYLCHCGEEWEMEWSCACNDRCPSCDSEIEPYQSDEIRDANDMSHDEWVSILESLVIRDASVLLNIPGVYEAVSEHYNNEIIERYERGEGPIKREPAVPLSVIRAEHDNFVKLAEFCKRQGLKNEDYSYAARVLDDVISRYE
jgi:hypothetical protein